MYRFGLTVLPVWPTCMLWGISSQVSTAAREAPTAAPIVSASVSRWLKLLGSPIPRPPETMMLASATSRRSLARAIISTTAVRTSPVASTTDTSAPPPASAAAKTFARSVMTDAPSTSTVCMALPERIGEVNWAPLMPTTSCTTGRPRRAARRAARSFERALASAMTVP